MKKGVPAADAETMKEKLAAAGAEAARKQSLSLFLSERREVVLE